MKPPSTDTKTAILIATHKETATAITTIMEKAYFVMEDKVYFVLLTVQDSFLLPVAKHVLTYFTTKKIKVHMLEMFVFDGLAY